MTDIPDHKPRFHLLHRWTPWEQYEWRGRVIGDRFTGMKIPDGGLPLSERRQRRKCEICGKEQDELVRNG